MKNAFVLCLIVSALFGCKTKSILKETNVAEVKVFTFQDSINQILTSDSLFFNAFSGLVVKSIEKDSILFDFRGQNYFTPASNTKLLTFYTSLMALEDKIKSVKYFENQDSLILWGTGDPSFLNDQFSENDYLQNLIRKTEKKVYLSFDNFKDSKYGPGWSWDDFYFAYQCDKSSFPVYGNVIHIYKDSADIQIIPAFFKNRFLPSFSAMEFSFMRGENDNNIKYNYLKVDTSEFDRYIPFRADKQTIVSLLESYFDKNIILCDANINHFPYKEIRGIDADSLYKIMLQESDNFIAEQLLLNVGSELFDTLNTAKVIEFSSSNWLNDLPHEFQWADGSGLSRYNMTTPHNMVSLLDKIYKRIDFERIKKLFPAGGQSGTIKNFYRAETPFIYAKTGTLRNNHSLSGFLIGDSGKTYIFSFMNSNYIRTSSEMKIGMDQILRILKRNL